MTDPAGHKSTLQKVEGDTSWSEHWMVLGAKDSTKDHVISPARNGGGYVCSYIGMDTNHALNGNDHAIAYGIGVLIVFLILSSLFYIAYTMFLSALIDVHNTVMIPTDHVSVDRGGSMLYLYRMWAAIPLFILLAGALWGIIRALEMKRVEGS